MFLWRWFQRGAFLHLVPPPVGQQRSGDNRNNGNKAAALKAIRLLKGDDPCRGTATIQIRSANDPQFSSKRR
ncbi:MAG: hypothetical protein DVB28_002082 [Verrucomicrobia bacterium]|nr:MAG: hypothetical protein DVB28_002082 [Verrucomicrobiota bacterium]